MTGFERWVGKVAVVTGVSSGIGKAIAERLVKEGLKVAGLARRLNRVEEMAQKLSKEKGQLYPMMVDLSDKEAILKAFEWIKDNLGPIHILVNNAAQLDSAGIIDGDIDVMERTVKVNLLGLSICTRQALRDMKANKVDGHIIHINSILGHKSNFYPEIKGSIYISTKHAVTALTEALRMELVLEGLTKIKVTSVSPGLVETEILPTEVFEANNVLKPEDVADVVYFVLSTPPHVTIQELTVRPTGEKLY